MVSVISALVYVFGVLGFALVGFFVVTMVLMARHRRRRRQLLDEVVRYTTETMALDAARRRRISVVTVADLLMEPELLDAIVRRRYR